jgi:ATP adenylyltransferase
MTCTICSWDTGKSDFRFIYQTTYWRVVLASNQALLGRCVVHLLRHEPRLSGLTSEEHSEWISLINSLETALHSAFKPTLFNWSCYMNHAYRENPPNPHVHWWVVPRYSHQIELLGMQFEDPDFGNPYDHSKRIELSDVQYKDVSGMIKEAFQI